MKVLYFAWVREMTEKPEEDIAKPDEVRTVGDLVEFMKTLGPGYQQVFSDDKMVRVAVNQEYVDLQHAVSDEDEVAFFPPVTGG